MPLAVLPPPSLHSFLLFLVPGFGLSFPPIRCNGTFRRGYGNFIYAILHHFGGTVSVLRTRDFFLRDNAISWPTYCVRIVAIFDISRCFTGTVLFYDDGLVKFSLPFHFGKDLRCLRGNISNGFRRISRSVQVYFSIPRSAKEVLFDIVFIMWSYVMDCWASEEIFLNRFRRV